MLQFVHDNIKLYIVRERRVHLTEASLIDFVQNVHYILWKFWGYYVQPCVSVALRRLVVPTLYVLYFLNNIQYSTYPYSGSFLFLSVLDRRQFTDWRYGIYSISICSMVICSIAICSIAICSTAIFSIKSFVLWTICFICQFPTNQNKYLWRLLKDFYNFLRISSVFYEFLHFFYEFLCNYCEFLQISMFFMDIWNRTFR